MLHVDMPTLDEVRAMTTFRADACVSIYLPTSPVTQEAEAARIVYGNLCRDALAQFEAVGLDKRRAAALAEQLGEVAEDDDLWAHLARSLAVFATPDRLRVHRLANRLSETAQASDRLYLKPLIRAVTFPQSAMVLALSEGGASLVEVHAEGAPDPVRVPDMPKDAASAVGKASINDPSPSQRITGAEGKKVRLRQYARAVDAALRPVVKGAGEPLILASNDPLATIFREVCTYPGLLPETVSGEIDRMTPAMLADAARPVLDAAYRAELASLRALFARRSGEGRATADVAQAARAATMGAVEALMVDIDDVIPGTVDDETGEVRFAEAQGATSYGVVDEIAGRVLATGGRVLGVRREDLPADGSLAAILRYAF